MEIFSNTMQKIFSENSLVLPKKDQKVKTPITMFTWSQKFVKFMWILWTYRNFDMEL